MENEKIEIMKRYEIQIRETLVKAIDVSNLLKDGKQIIAFNKLNGVIQKLNSLHGQIKELSQLPLGLKPCGLNLD